MDYSLAGRRAVLFGAGGAVGHAMLQVLHEEGLEGVAVDRTPLSGLPAGFVPLQADLSSPEDVLSACESVRESGAVDVLLVATGAFRAAPIEMTAPKTLEDLLWANARLPYHIVQGLLAPLRAARGRAVLIGAMGGLEPRGGQSAYAASKAALHSIVQATAQELKGSHATINALLPTTIDTQANRQAMPNADPSHWVSPRRLAQIALFLSSDAAQDINGALIPVRGRG